MKLYSTSEIANILNLTPGRIRQISIELNIGKKIGRDRIFSDDDLAALRTRNTKTGRPPGSK